MTSRHQVALDRVGDNLLGVMGETLRGLMAEPDVTDIILNPPLPGELTDHCQGRQPPEAGAEGPPLQPASRRSAFVQQGFCGGFAPHRACLVML
jgi:hypothetical protein